MTGGAGRDYVDRKLSEMERELRNYFKAVFKIFHKFMDEHYFDKLILIENRNSAIDDKLDTLEWLSRYGIYFSTDQMSTIYLKFKTYY